MITFPMKFILFQWTDVILDNKVYCAISCLHYKSLSAQTYRSLLPTVEYSFILYLLIYSLTCEWS